MTVVFLVPQTILTLPSRLLVTEREKIKINDLDHVVSTNRKSNQVNDTIDN